LFGRRWYPTSPESEPGEVRGGIERRVEAAGSGRQTRSTRRAVAERTLLGGPNPVAWPAVPARGGSPGVPGTDPEAEEVNADGGTDRQSLCQGGYAACGNDMGLARWACWQF